MKRCKLCGIMLEDEATVCPSCKAICDSENIGYQNFSDNYQKKDEKKKKSFLGVLTIALTIGGVIGAVFEILAILFLLIAFIYSWMMGDGGY